jgi:hypothetical protein
MDSISKYEENKEYYEKLDKRTKQYKDYEKWKEAHEAAPEGLGDSLEWFTETTGIKAAVKFLAGEDCGCDKRKEKLNELFRYRKPNCLREDEYNYLTDLFSSNTNAVSQKQLLRIYNRVFNTRQQPTQCSPCVKKLYDELKKYYETYNG